MGEHTNFLITIFYKGPNGLLKCALKVDNDLVSEDCRAYPIEEENRKLLHALLPLHVRSCGPIVEVEEIFEIVTP